METYRTPLTHEEVKGLQGNLKALIASQGSYVVRNFLDLDWATKQIVAYSKIGQVVKFYQGDKFCGILCFDVGKSWWSSVMMVSEVLILSMPDTHGFQRYALKELQKIAREHDAQIITGGCIFQDNPQIITNGYKKFGYNLSYPTYTKVVSYDSK